MTATLTSTSPETDRCPACGAPLAGEIVRITAPQYEALMAAISAAKIMRADLLAVQLDCDAITNFDAALRTAGIPEETKP